VERFKLKIMKRIFLTNESKAWFDEHRAKEYEEGANYDGSNRVSKATGSFTEHEKLWYTAGEKFVLQSWSNFQNRMTEYKEIELEEAVLWLAANDKNEAAEAFDTIGILKSYEI